jgi:hypothetical protein
MTDTTHTIREQAFLPVACDIPEGMTLAQYRAKRIARTPRPWRRLLRRAQSSTK